MTKIRSSLKVYCGSTRSHSFTWYNAAQVTNIGTKFSADSDRASIAYRTALYKLWKEHPHLIPSCCFSNTNYYIQYLNTLMKFDNNFYSLVAGLQSTVAIELRKELASRCSNGISEVFCRIYPALDIIDVAAKLPSSKSSWTTETSDHEAALLVHFAVLKRNYATYFSGLTLDENKLVVDCTEVILKLIKSKNIQKLKTFEAYLPKKGALKFNQACKVDHLCLFMKIIEQVRLYIDSSNADSDPPLYNGKKRFTLNTAVDYREFLKQKQLDRILTVLSEFKTSSVQIANDLKKHATTQFTELKTYFETIETFNQQISSADIDYIDGQLVHYNKAIKSIVSVVKRDMKILLDKTLLAAGLNIAEKVIVLAMEIASAFNPLKWLTGGTSAKDILEATADLANAIADRVQVKAIFRAFNDLRTKIKQFSDKIGKNDAFLQNVKKLVYKETETREAFDKSKKEFLQQYRDYTPQVTKPEIDEIGAIWEVLIGATCDVVDGFDTALAAPIKSWIYDEGYCISLVKDTAKLVSTYEEIYDYQFDLMDSMASYVRASVALDAAAEINTEFTEITNLNINAGATFTTLQIMGGLTFVAYNVHLIETVRLYCNVLEYMESGERPSNCKGVKTNVALLLATPPPLCRSSTLQFYHVPTQGSNKAYMDMDDLFKGEEVTFKVPSTDWLIENKWIYPNERNFSFYVKRFEVYLPVKTEKPQKFISTVIPSISNEIIPNSNEYILIPKPHMVYEYMTGPSRLYCHDPKFQNPYTSCETTDISEVCKLSVDNRQHLYPSLYSQWSITVKGGEELTVPKPTVNMTVIVGLQVCKVAPDESTPLQEAAVIQQAENEQCCPTGKYRPKFNSECESCPSGSASALAGYYCEKEAQSPVFAQIN